MNNSSIGTIRIGNKRNGSPHKPRAGEIVIDVDRANRTLGNRHILHNPNDPIERANVILANRKDMDADLAKKGPMYQALQDISHLVESGKNVILMCWCHDKPCHGDHYRDTIYNMVKERNPSAQIPSVQIPKIQTPVPQKRVTRTNTPASPTLDLF